MNANLRIILITWSYFYQLFELYRLIILLATSLQFVTFPGGRPAEIGSPRVTVLRGQYLRVWAESPVALHRGHTYILNTGHWQWPLSSWATVNQKLYDITEKKSKLFHKFIIVWVITKQYFYLGKLININSVSLLHKSTADWTCKLWLYLQHMRSIESRMIIVVLAKNTSFTG